MTTTADEVLRLPDPRTSLVDRVVPAGILIAAVPARKLTVEIEAAEA
jgi:hypothetical protein